MPATTKKFTPEIDAALYEELVAVAKQNGQSQRYVLEQALSFYLRNVVPSQHLVRREVMDAFERSVAGNGDRGKRQRLAEQSIDRDKSFHASLHKDVRISVQQLFIVMVGDGQKKKALLSKIPLDPADDHRSVCVAEVPGDYADCVGTLHAKRARQIIGPVIQLARSRKDALLGVFWNGASRGGIIQHRRDCAGRESNVFSDGFQRDNPKLSVAGGLVAIFHWAVSLNFREKRT